MRFTDAHAAGAVCVPSRYALLTGRYPFRNTGFRVPAKGPLIEPERPTIATMMRGAGYATAMIGKWHLGFDGGDQFDYGKPLRGGPCDHGFDSFFGQHASLDIPPYFFIANDRCVEPASETIAASSSPDWSPVQGAFWRAGKIAPSFKHVEALPIYTRKATDYIESHARAGNKEPFFLYFRADRAAHAVVAHGSISRKEPRRTVWRFLSPRWMTPSDRCSSRARPREAIPDDTFGLFRQ